MSKLQAQKNELKLIVVRTPYSKANKLFLSYEMAGRQYRDSFRLKPGKTVYIKNLSQPVEVMISCNDKNINAQKFFISNRLIEAEITQKSLIIQRDFLQIQFEDLTTNDLIRPVYFPLYGELTEKNDTAGLNKISALFDSLKTDDINKAYNYVKTNPQSSLVLFAFQRYSAFASDYSIIENEFLQLPAWAKNSPDGKSIAQKIQGVKQGQIGARATDFTQKKSDGKTLQFGSLKGKYVLLDFWASWCLPCRKQHPGLIELYNQYQSKGFEIISVSLDNNKNAWLQAITKDQLKWSNTSDLKGQQNEIAIKYGINAIPANFLISPDGFIIAKNLEPAELKIILEQKL